MQRNAFFPELLRTTLVGLTITVALVTTRPLFAHDVTHVVQQGETLSGIAQQFGADIETLRSINGLESEDLIFYGLFLKLPDSAAREDTEEPELADVSDAAHTHAGQPSEIPGSTSIHIVRAGEHLGILANRYGTSEDSIARANNLGDANIILPGQRLVVTVSAQGTETAVSADIESAVTAVAEIGETLGPAGSDIYHQHTEYPTSTEKWIDVDLSEQRVVAYEGTTQVKTFIVSTGLAGTPTVQGEFHIWTKTSIQDLYGGNRAAGDFFYLKDVQWVQYFYEDFAFHGAYWHNNFGQPMSRGCINMRNEEARWLYEWAGPASSPDESGWVFSSGGDPGTLVVVHE